MNIFAEGEKCEKCIWLFFFQSGKKDVLTQTFPDCLCFQAVRLTVPVLVPVHLTLAPMPERETETGVLDLQARPGWLEFIKWRHMQKMRVSCSASHQPPPGSHWVLDITTQSNYIRVTESKYIHRRDMTTNETGIFHQASSDISAKELRNRRLGLSCQPLFVWQRIPNWFIEWLFNAGKISIAVKDVHRTMPITWQSDTKIIRALFIHREICPKFHCWRICFAAFVALSSC